MNSASIQRLERFEISNHFRTTGLDFSSSDLPSNYSTSSYQSIDQKSKNHSNLLIQSDKIKPYKNTQMLRYLPRSSNRRRLLEAQLATSSVDLLAETETNILSSKDINITIKTKEDLICILRGTELEKFEITGIVQMQTKFSEDKNINNKLDNKIICDLKMCGIPKSVERLEVNRKYQIGPLPDQFKPGNENDHVVRVSMPLSDQFASTLRYSISPVFKLMIVKVAIAIKVVTPPVGPSGISRSYLRVQAQIKLNPNFRDQLEDLSVMVSTKKLLVYKVENTTEDVILDPGFVPPSTESGFIPSVADEETFATAHLENFRVMPKGNYNRREAVVSWTTVTGTAASGSSNDFEAALDLRTAHDSLLSLSIDQLEDIVRRSPSLPVIVKAKYRSNLISKTRFSLAALLHNGRVLEPLDVGELQQSELLSSTIEYRFLE